VSFCCRSFASCADAQFTQERAESDLARMEKQGLDPSTKLLRQLIDQSIQGPEHVVDIGAGVAALTRGLLESWDSARATVVEASAPYLEVARREARASGIAQRISFLRGDATALEDDLPQEGDLVVLDRVVCCYPHYRPLLLTACQLARGHLALSYPRDRWWVHLATAFGNLTRRFRGNDFRTYVHSVTAINGLLERCGLELQATRTTPIWSCELWQRVA